MSSIYKTGAISVNNGSNIVTGNGTSFLGVAGTLAGDLFSVDGVNFYEIYQVDSNNQIRIRTIPAGLPFQQSSKSNSDYAILRNFTSSTSAEVAARVVAVQQKWHLREEEMTGWFASTDNYYNVTSINGDIISVITPAGIANLLGTAATRDVITSENDITAGRVLTTSTDFNFFSLRNEGGYYPPAANRDIDAVASGDHALYSAGNQGTFPFNPNIAFYHITTQKNYTGFSRTQFATGYFGTNASNNVPTYSMRTMDNSGGGWTPWVNFYHSGNTNFNEFGGSNGDNIAVGVAVSNSIADFYFPLNSKVEASGITLSSPTHFDVVTPNGTTVASDIAPSFSGRSSSRLGTCQVTGLSGRSVGETLLLRINNNQATLSFNF